MATVTLEFACVDGQGGTLVAELYNDGDDTLVASAACTELSNNKGNYTANLVDVATGTYWLRVANASNQTLLKDRLRHIDTERIERPFSQEADPWATYLPGDYEEGQAGNMLSDVANQDIPATITEWTVTIYDNRGRAVRGCRVWLTNDRAGSDIAEPSQLTDNQGTTTFVLPIGEYWMWKEHPSIVFRVNPEPVVVS